MINKLETQWSEEDWQEMRLSDDFLFGYAMQDAELARIFLESLLEVEIETVEHVRMQEVVELAPHLRGVRLDVRLKADGRLVNVEMQTADKGDIPWRVRYYQALGDGQLLVRSEPFRALPEFLTIFVCTFDPFRKKGARDEDGLPMYTIRHTVEEDAGLDYYDGRRIMLFNTAAWKKSLAQERKSMLKYIQDGGRVFESERVSGFAERVSVIKSENSFRRNYMTLSMKIMETKLEGIEQGRAEAQARIAELEARLAKYEGPESGAETNAGAGEASPGGKR